ncbi:MAG TPA: FAD-dependent oxidoreductase, partial [Chitinophagaceae bacterium]|nr:FAD-dependent oxidoreductase [Chitinophagaceae bacterium]
EKPCTDAELTIAKTDGCSIIWLAAPKKVIGEKGKVTALECSVMQLGQADKSGRRSPIDTGETFTLEVDMIIKAAGQAPFTGLVTGNHIGNASGKIIIDEKSSTNIKGLFAGGDCVNGGKEVVDAVQAGKNGAVSILRYLENN